MGGGLPLSGITVVAIEQAVAAPFATRQLADLGARVIKVERPGSGDFARHYDRSVKGLSSHFVWLNRGKESITLDLKDPDAGDIIRRLVGHADVFVQNLVPGALERLGLDSAALSADHPRLITCDMSGYGAGGSWATRKAYDLLVQCETGLVSLTGPADGASKVGISIADIATGMYALTNILVALYHRALTGQARPVSVAMFDALGEWMGAPAHFFDEAGYYPERTGLRHATIAPYGAFRSADGELVVVAVQNEREWGRLCSTFLMSPALADDPRFESNTSRVRHKAELETVVADRFAQLRSDQAIALLDDAGVANARVRDLAAFLSHPVLAERSRWRSLMTPGGAVRAMAPPVGLADTEAPMGPVPDLGQHTQALLEELGFDAETIERMRARGAV